MRSHEPLELDSSRRGSGQRLLPVVCLLGVAGLGCTPSIADDPVPDEMQFDTEVSPQRVP